MAFEEFGTVSEIRATQQATLILSPAAEVERRPWGTVRQRARTRSPAPGNLCVMVPGGKKLLEDPGTLRPAPKTEQAGIGCRFQAGQFLYGGPPLRSCVKVYAADERSIAGFAVRFEPLPYHGERPGTLREN